MGKRAMSAQRETTPGYKVSSGLCFRRSGPDEEALKSPTIITVDFLERAFDALPTLEGIAQNVAKEACASLEDGAPVGGLPNAN